MVLEQGEEKVGRKIKRGGVAALLLCLILSVCAQAELITIAIEATVDAVSDPYDHLENQINTDSILTGHYTYESTTPDSNPSTESGKYWHYNPPCGIFLTSGGFEFATDPCDVQFSIGIGDDIYPPNPYDVYIIESYQNLTLSNGVEVTYCFWQLTDPNATAISSDFLPTAVPVLSEWGENSLNIMGGMRGNEFGIVATVTSALLVPEPATIFVFGLGGLALLQKHRR